MDAFESLVSSLLRAAGYWTLTGFKVELTQADKREIRRPSSPRWEIDVVAYRGVKNELLAVECKSFLDSPGVIFRRGRFEPRVRYKLFEEQRLRRVVLNRLATQLATVGLCRPKPKVTLCLAAGRVATRTDANGLRLLFERRGWELFDQDWIKERLEHASRSGYEDSVAHVVAKLALRDGSTRAQRVPASVVPRHRR